MLFGVSDLSTAETKICIFCSQCACLDGKSSPAKAAVQEGRETRVGLSLARDDGSSVGDWHVRVRRVQVAAIYMIRKS